MKEGRKEGGKEEREGGRKERKDGPQTEEKTILWCFRYFRLV